ncbi:unnamed protein product, partial [Larinioides sclopetarius]
NSLGRPVRRSTRTAAVAASTRISQWFRQRRDEIIPWEDLSEGPPGRLPWQRPQESANGSDCGGMRSLLMGIKSALQGFIKSSPLVFQIPSDDEDLIPQRDRFRSRSSRRVARMDSEAESMPQTNGVDGGGMAEPPASFPAIVQESSLPGVEKKAGRGGRRRRPLPQKNACGGGTSTGMSSLD